jgi:hypothetical protein
VAIGLLALFGGMAKAQASDKPRAEIPVGPAWLPPKEPPAAAVSWVNGRSFPAVLRDTIPFVMGGLVAAAKTHPQLKPGVDWTAQPEPDSAQDLDQAIAAKLHIGLRLGTVLADAQLVLVDPAQVALIPEWDDDEEAAAYASVAQLPACPLYLDFESDDGSPAAWEAETWPLPFHLRGAICWIAEGLLSIVPFGSVGGAQLWGGTDYQAWARWSFVQTERPEWPAPGPGDFIASADSRVVSWVDVEGESICAHQGAITFNLTRRVLRVLWALETLETPLVPPNLPRAERRRAKRAGQEIGLVSERLPCLPEQETSEADGAVDESAMSVPCPVQNAHSRLNQAHVLWHEALDAYNDPDAFVTKLNALIQTMRNVTLGLQKDLGDFPTTKEWYERWQERMRADSRMAWLKKARNQIVHKGELETHSKVRVMVVGEMLRGTPVQLDVDSAAPVAEIARRLSITGVAGRASQEGTLVVERRWTVEALPDDELLDVLAHCYGVLASILDEAHHQLETSIATCEISVGDPCGWTTVFAHPSGRPGCMWAGTEARTSRRDLSTGAPVHARIVSARGPDISLEELQDRYSLTSLEPIPDEADVFDRARILHEKGRMMLAVDKEHAMIAWLFRDGEPLTQLRLEPEDQRGKYLVMDAVASEAQKLGANELILSAEAWEAPAVDRDDARANMRATERDDRTEAFLTHLVTQDGRSLTLRSRIERSDSGEVELADPEDVDDVPPLMRPLLEAWAEWPS